MKNFSGDLTKHAAKIISYEKKAFLKKDFNNN